MAKRLVLQALLDSGLLTKPLVQICGQGSDALWGSVGEAWRMVKQVEVEVETSGARCTHPFMFAEALNGPFH